MLVVPSPAGGCPTEVTLSLEPWSFADGSTETVGKDGTLEVTLPAYGFRWLRSAP